MTGRIFYIIIICRIFYKRGLSMGVFLIAISIVGIIIFLVLAVILIRFLFTSFVLSRILCFAAAIASFVLAFFIIKTPDDFNWTLVIATTATTAFSWMFFIGPIIFDVDWDGSFTLDFDTGTLEPNMVGGFFMNTIGAFGVSALLYMLLGQEFLAIFFILPILLCIANIAFIIYAAYN